MRNQSRRYLSISVITVFAIIAGVFLAPRNLERGVRAQTTPTPTPAAASPQGGKFDQPAALAKLREQIKGHEKEPAPQVFKNIKVMTGTTAERLLAVMEFGFARSLGVDCTHCHIPDNWAAEDKPEKQITRDMSAMNTTINKELLKNIKNLKSQNPIVNCTTCHRGEVKPATNLPAPAKQG